MNRRTLEINEGDFWADKLMDLANLQAVVLVFSQLVGSRVHLQGILLGGIIYLLIVIASVVLRRTKK